MVLENIVKRRFLSIANLMKNRNELFFQSFEEFKNIRNLESEKCIIYFELFIVFLQFWEDLSQNALIMGTTGKFSISNLVKNAFSWKTSPSIIVQWGQYKRADFKWDKIADFGNGTKPSIPKMRQNRRFRKWDKTADSENETKPPILRKRKNCYQNCSTDKSVLA